MERTFSSKINTLEVTSVHIHKSKITSSLTLKLTREFIKEFIRKYKRAELFLNSRAALRGNLLRITAHSVYENEICY